MFVEAEKNLAISRMSKSFEALVVLNGTGCEVKCPKEIIDGRGFNISSFKKRTRYLRRFLPCSLMVTKEAPKAENVRQELVSNLSVILPFYDLGIEFSRMMVQIPQAIYRSMTR